MTLSRRAFLAAAAAAGLARPGTGVARPGAGRPASPPGSRDPKPGPRRRASAGRGGQIPPDRFDPWVEVSAQNLRHNVAQVHRLAGGRPILAVVKNNAYGLDLLTAARLLEPLDPILGFAVVKTEAAVALKEAGVAKPVLHMGLASEADGIAMARLGVRPSLYTEAAVERAAAMAEAVGGPVPAHAYLDTGMGRMGMPYYRALPWLEALAEAGTVALEGTYMAFTEDPDFDPEQLSRFLDVAARARERGIEPGALHAASSSGVFELPDAHLDLVRPGIALWGGYPNDPGAQRPKAELRCAFRLRARVVRVERLRPGDSVSYGRNYVAEAPTWIATIPAGHTDGMPRVAIHGGRVLIRNQTYPVIGAVSASHCIVELGRNSPVSVGDLATLLGPDHPDVVPDTVAERTGASVYDLFMHLNPTLPRVVV